MAATRHILSILCNYPAMDLMVHQPGADAGNLAQLLDCCHLPDL